VTTSSPPTVAAIREALEAVTDPCSTATAHPVSIVDLGLVRSITIDDQRMVRIDLGTTGPSCLYYPTIASTVARVVSELPGVAEVDVRHDRSFKWDESAMDDEARQRRADGLLHHATSPIRPQQWRENQQTPESA
jgi:metal-sulfur cluster biosynthetic enzyme